MIRLLSLPMIITSGISLIFGIFFLLLHFRLSSRYQETVRYYIIFALLALVSSVFLGAFSVVLNSGENLDHLDIANRITIIGGMFTVLLAFAFLCLVFWLQRAGFAQVVLRYKHPLRTSLPGAQPLFSGQGILYHIALLYRTRFWAIV